MNNFKRDFAGWTRWLHIYLSMFSFATLLFFAITGITLNHTHWIEGKEKVRQVEGDLPLDLMQGNGANMDNLKVVEYMRNNYAIRAPLADISTDETECSFSFKGPGFNADGLIDLSNGHYQLTITRYGLIAVINDLHKGRDSGTAWAWLIDISAVLMILVSITGLLMIFFLKRRRLDGLLVAAIGTIVIVLIYYFFV